MFPVVISHVTLTNAYTFVSRCMTGACRIHLHVAYSVCLGSRARNEYSVHGRLCAPSHELARDEHTSARHIWLARDEYADFSVLVLVLMLVAACSCSCS